MDDESEWSAGGVIRSDSQDSTAFFLQQMPSDHLFKVLQAPAQSSEARERDLV